MLVRLYSVRDIKTDLYEPPFGSHNDETAIRYFSRLMKQIPTMLENPEDFNLHCLGVMNDSTGTIQPHPTVQFITSGISLVNTPKEEIPHGQENKIGDDAPIQSST